MLILLLYRSGSTLVWGVEFNWMTRTLLLLSIVSVCAWTQDQPKTELLWPNGTPGAVGEEDKEDKEEDVNEVNGEIRLYSKENVEKLV